MIIRKLRKQRNWSQDQLSKLSGLSLRTIQRIEGGNKASMESLKSLSAVFEIDIRNLEQGVVVVDKDSEQWKKAPLWVRIIFIGSNTVKFKRKDAVILEIILIGTGIILSLAGLFHPDGNKAEVLMLCSIAFILSAYYMSIKLRMGDKYLVW